MDRKKQMSNQQNQLQAPPSGTGSAVLPQTDMLRPGQRVRAIELARFRAQGTSRIHFVHYAGKGQYQYDPTPDLALGPITDILTPDGVSYDQTGQWSEEALRRLRDNQ
jgi:hypothetical protein